MEFFVKLCIPGEECLQSFELSGLSLSESHVKKDLISSLCTLKDSVISREGADCSEKITNVRGNFDVRARMCECPSLEHRGF